MPFNVLVLGGTSEARRLCERLAELDRGAGADAPYAALLSFAGRTQSLQRPSTPHRVGGFGGADGLARFLREGRFDALVDATHAFAAQISANAVRATELAGTPLIRLVHPAWTPRAGDRWLEVPDMASAARALGSVPSRVFLSIGRLELGAFRAAPEHEYLVRAVDPFDPELPRARVIAARGPFRLDDERALLERERIERLVSKNSGTAATYAKIEAARELGVPVVMVAQPQLPAAELARDLEAIVAWLERLRHGDSRSQRGE